MANIESKNLLFWLKAMSRGQNLPLDASEVHESLDSAKSYAASAIAYGGQTIKVKLDDGKYREYILQPTEDGYVLEEVGDISAAKEEILEESVAKSKEAITVAKQETIDVSKTYADEQIVAALTIVEF